jgi:hypothetical protein
LNDRSLTVAPHGRRVRISYLREIWSSHLLVRRFAPRHPKDGLAEDKGIVAKSRQSENADQFPAHLFVDLVRRQ